MITSGILELANAIPKNFSLWVVTQTEILLVFFLFYILVPENSYCVLFFPPFMLI